MKLFAVILAILYPCYGSANVQDVFSSLFGKPERQNIRGSYNYHIFKRANSEDSAHPFSSQSHDFAGSIPLNKDPDHYWKLLPSMEYRELDTNQTFPSGRVFPRRLWNPSLGASLYHLYPSGDSAVGSLSISSPSDRPYHSLRNVGFQGTFVYKKMVDMDTSWLFFLFLSNNRGLLDYIPMPGVAYAFRPANRLRMVVGIPFVSLIWNATDSLLFTSFYLPPHSGTIKASYFIFGPAHLYAQIKTNSRAYFLDDRTDTKEKFFDQDNLVQGGVSMPLERQVLIDASVGNSFGRRFFLGTKSKDRDGLQVRHVDNALFADVKLVANF